ncbi:MAG: ATP-binding cassette domain-containing protein [Bacteroidia bacterium]|nr:ATP-binding cassette domain-containing protein [Bacteroidia bacterium]MCZ2247937.1 polysaccharide ABC transporter ATP-binding protein [Bacteroidia bacterium]
MDKGLAIKVENLHKQYRLGLVSTGTLAHDLNRWWHIVRGKEDPYQKVTITNNLKLKDKQDFIWSLKEINFEVKQGEVLGIIGRNGAGKSTLLKILSKITTPTIGKVYLNGRIASLLEVGTGFHPELTGRENIYMNGTILGMRKSEIKKKFDKIVDFAGVELYIDTPVKRYSSGMYLRLAFAVAAHLESEILIVDEVLAVGDAEFQKKCLGKMGEVSRGEGKTVLFVSHNMGAVQSLCHRGILLNHGSISYDGAIEETIKTYHKSIVSMLQQTYLANRDDREGNGQLKLTSFKVNSVECNNIIKIECGNTIYFDLEIESIEASKGDKILIGVYDESGQRLLFLDSSSEKLTIHYNKGLNDVRVTLPEGFSLGIGQYTINTILYKNMEIADYLQQVAIVEIVEGDFYKIGKNVVNHARIFVRSSWKINHTGEILN